MKKKWRPWLRGWREEVIRQTGKCFKCGELAGAPAAVTDSDVTSLSPFRTKAALKPQITRFLTGSSVAGGLLRGEGSWRTRAGRPSSDPENVNRSRLWLEGKCSLNPSWCSGLYSMLLLFAGDNDVIRLGRWASRHKTKKKKTQLYKHILNWPKL